MNYKKCDICLGFCAEEELDLVTIVLSKHKECKLDQVFGRSELKKVPIDLPRVEQVQAQMPVLPTGAPAYVAEEIAKMGIPIK